MLTGIQQPERSRIEEFRSRNLVALHGLCADPAAVPEGRDGATRWRRPGAVASTGSPGSDGVDCMVGSDLLDRLTATDRLHGDPGLELGTVSAAFAHGGSPLSVVGPRLRG